MTAKSETSVDTLAGYVPANRAASLAQLRRKAQRGLGKLGWMGLVAIVLLVVCLAFYVSVIRPLQARVQASEQGATSARQAMESGINAQRAEQTPSEQLATFYRFFPGEKRSPLWLEKMVTVAEKNGLSLNQGEYKVAQDKAGKLMRYKITLPVQGSYPQIRKFLLSLGTEIPAMALENVQFDRQHVADASVQAEIKLILYLVQES